MLSDEIIFRFHSPYTTPHFDGQSCAQFDRVIGRKIELIPEFGGVIDTNNGVSVVSALPAKTRQDELFAIRIKRQNRFRRPRRTNQKSRRVLR